jgi:hypothetical protein
MATATRENSWNGLNRQSIYDICLQIYGTLDLLSNGESALYKLIKDNNIDSINVGNFAGERIIFDPTLVSNNAITSFSTTQQQTSVIFATNSYVPPPDGLATDDGVLIETDGGIIITVD